MLSIDIGTVRVTAARDTHAPAARRVRVAVVGLERNADLAGALESHFARLSWIASVHADPRSGRVLLCYREGFVFSDEVLGQQPEPGNGHPPPSARPAAAPSGGVRETLRSLFGVVARRGRQTAPAAARAGDVGWHALDKEAVLARLGTGDEGLTAAEASGRLASQGSNSVEAERQRTSLEILATQVANLPTMLLLGSAVVSVALGDLFDAGAIVLVVALNAGIGYRIERKNERLLASWRRLEAGQATVIRAGQVTTIGAADLVPGDMLIVRAGDVLPADARVVDAHRLACDEAPLTGESEPQTNGPDPVDAAAPLAERHSMLCAGTSVVAGRGRTVVVATGQGTEMARVRALIAGERSPEAPLQKRLGDLGRRATFVGLGAAGLMTAIGALRGQPLLGLVRGAVALAVASIPEGMPLVATAALVQTMSRMRRKGMVVRRVSSAETLGEVTVVCIDKTGTLTRNEMQLEVLELDGRRLGADALHARPGDVRADRLTLTLAAGVLNSDIEYHDDVVLENADLRSILAAVGEGRIVQDNLRRSVHFLLGSNLSEVLLMLGGTVAGLQPLQPLQLLWLNLVTDTLPGLALALEPGRPEVLDRKPAPPGAPLLSRSDWVAVVRDAALLGGLAGGAYLVGGGPVTLATLIGAQLGYAFVCRAPGAPLERRLVTMIGGAAGLQLLAMVVPPIGAALGLPALAGLPLLAFGAGLALPIALRFLSSAAQRMPLPAAGAEPAALLAGG
jgi:Ca2+-transporting ATPase